LDSRVTQSAPWTIIIPVKELSAAKSRLSEGLAPEPAAGELAFGFFVDTLAAAQRARSAGEIVVVTRDPRVREHASARGAAVVDDTGIEGINAAAAHGAAHGWVSGGLAVVVSDLPCLTPAALDTALVLAAEHDTSFLPDLRGDGTTMWFARQGPPVRSRFGIGSAVAHLASGAADLVACHPQSGPALETARRDVDTRDALADARHAGPGSATSELLSARHGSRAD
jgi:2-phospho-L-lactate guanylyltransferase